MSQISAMISLRYEHITVIQSNLLNDS